MGVGRWVDSWSFMVDYLGWWWLFGLVLVIETGWDYLGWFGLFRLLPRTRVGCIMLFSRYQEQIAKCTNDPVVGR